MTGQEGLAVGVRSAGESTLGSVLGLTGEELDVLAPLLTQALSSIGLNGEAIFSDLAAGKSLGKSMNIPPEAADILYARAHHWFAIGRYDRAESVFRTLCVLDGTKRDHWLGYGVCLKIRGFHPAALVAFQAAARADVQVRHLAPRKASLDEAFLRLLA